MENQNIKETLNLILTLQKNSCCNSSDCQMGCTRPFLGPTGSTICYNTRPITLYRCCSNDTWTMPYELNGETGTSSVFRIENIEDDCATFRILIPNLENDPVTYTLSNSYFTIDLSCVLAMQCLNDTYVI